MYNTLPQFYTSKEWRSLRQRLIMERASKTDGLIICEYSGQILLHSYDIVAHHVIPLTTENVNDHSISLNPDNIMIVSQQAHNEIHSRFGHCTERKVYYVYGPPCAGKTTFVQRVKGNSDLVVDIDSIWQCLTGSADRCNKPPALKQNVFGVRDLLLDMVRTRAGKWERAYIIDGGAVESDRSRKMALYGAEPVFIDTDRETCLKRLRGDSVRSGAHYDEWVGYIDRWFEDYTG